MLPYTPLHHVLLIKFGQSCPDDNTPALVMTSGNASSEPISLGNREALKRLESIADGFLFHNRDILIRTDDSVLRIDPDTEKPVIYRRARGFAPSPVFLPSKGETVLGLGPELKCTLCLTKGDQAFLSQHIGNMTNLEVFGFYKEILDHLRDVLQVSPKLVVRDKHPNYMTTDLANDLTKELDLPVKSLQHHFAHIYAVLAENKHLGPALGLALDGTGYGEDGTIWGGEFLFADSATLEQKRAGRFSRMILPGGDMAVKETLAHRPGGLVPTRYGPVRPALALDGEIYPRPPNSCPRSLKKTSIAPKHPVAADFMDAISALLGVSTAISYEGQAAIRLEDVQDFTETGAYPCRIKDGETMVLDTLDLAAHVIEDIERGVEVPVISRRFHLGLARGVAELAKILARKAGTEVIALSGGATQNMSMTREIVNTLEAKEFTVLTHSQVPPNDGSVSLGQAFWGQRFLELNG